MEEKTGRYRAPGPLDIAIEIVRPEPDADSFLYRRLFEGEVVMEATITPEQAAEISASLIATGWHIE
jgi:hypothetical protein